MDTRTEFGSDGSRALIDSARDAANELASALAGTMLPQDALPGYRILREIRRGGQGVVYRAVQASTGRDVAIKVLRDGAILESRDRARFAREVRMLGRLQHPNIVTIHDGGVAGGHCYLVMDYVEGVHLDAFFPTGTPVQRKLELFSIVCDAVHAAHLRGIIHRDLKPSNVLVDAGGSPHVLDFGLGKESGELAGMTHAQSITITGQFLGSIPWSSPEQAGGATDQTDSRTDIYSLGVVLYQLVTGRFPYPVAGRMRDVISNIVEIEPARPSSFCKEVDSDVDTMVLKCLAKDPQRRYQSAGELAQDVRRYLTGEPIDARRESTIYVLRKRMRKHRVAVAAGLAIILILIGSSVVAWTLYGRSQSNLWLSYLAQARATRVTHQEGQRLEALDALTKAAAIKPSIELRNEAIAALSLADLRPLREWQVEDGWNAVYFSPDLSHYVLKGQQFSSFSLRRTEDDHEFFRTDDFGNDFGQVVFSRDGRYCIVSVKGEYRIWDIHEQRWRFHFAVEKFHNGQVDFSPDSSVLAYCAPEEIRLYRWNEGTLETMPYEGARHLRVRYSPGGESLATWSAFDSEVLVHELVQKTPPVRLKHSWPAGAVVWHPGGERLATAGGDRQVHLWDSQSGELLHTFTEPQSLQAWLDFSPDGTVLMSSGWDSMTYFWDIQSRAFLLLAQGNCIRFDSEGRLGRVSTAGDKLTPMIVQFERGTVKRHVINPMGEVTTDRFGIVLIPPGRVLLSYRDDGVFFYDLDAREHLAHLDIGPTHSLIWNGRRSSIVTCGPQGAHEWPVSFESDTLHVASPRLIFGDVRMPNQVNCSLSADGTTLAVCATASEAVVLSMDDPGSARRIGHHDHLRFVSLNSDGSRLATSTWHGTDVKVWDTATGLLSFALPTYLVVHSFFRPDRADLITSGGLENCIWDSETGRQVRCFDRTGRPGLPGAVVMSPDGQTLILQDQQNVLQLYDLSTWDVLARFELPDNSQAGYRHVAYTPDGSGLVATTGSGPIAYVWNLREIRQQLSAIGLDWSQPPLRPVPGEPGNSARMVVTLDQVNLR